MFFKLLGSVIVITSSALWGYLNSLRYKQKIENLESMKTAMMIYKSEMMYYAPEISEVFYKISNKTNGETSEFFLNAAMAFEQKNGENAMNIWEKEILNFKSDCFDKEDINALDDFGKAVNHPSIERQIAASDCFIDYLNRKKEFLREEDLKNSRLLKSGSILAGIMVVIVLL